DSLQARVHDRHDRPQLRLHYSETHRKLNQTQATKRNSSRLELLSHLPSQRRMATIAGENACGYRVHARQEYARDRVEEVACTKSDSECDRDYYAEKYAEQALFQHAELVSWKQYLNSRITRQETEQPKTKQKPEASEERILHVVRNQEYFRKRDQ